jgi:anti-sigma B factor antagonist
MAFALQNYQQDGYSVLNADGKFNVVNVADIRKSAESALGLGIKSLVLDMSRTTILDSAGIGCIIAIHKQYAASKGRLYLVSASQGINALLNSSSLNKILTIMPSIADVEAVLKSGILFQEHGYYGMFTLPAEFNLAIVKPLREKLDQSRNKGYTHFVFDFQRCKFITSMGIGLLMNLHKDLSGKGGGIFLLKIPPEVRTIMQSSNVFSVLPAFETIREIEDKLMPGVL